MVLPTHSLNLTCKSNTNAALFEFVLPSFFHGATIWVEICYLPTPLRTKAPFEFVRSFELSGGRDNSPKGAPESRGYFNASASSFYS